MASSVIFPLVRRYSNENTPNVWVAVMVGAVIVQAQKGAVGSAASAGAQPCVLKQSGKLLGSGRNSFTLVSLSRCFCRLGQKLTMWSASHVWYPHSGHSAWST